MTAVSYFSTTLGVDQFARQRARHFQMSVAGGALRYRAYAMIGEETASVLLCATAMPSPSPVLTVGFPAGALETTAAGPRCATTGFCRIRRRGDSAERLVEDLLLFDGVHLR